MRVFTGDELSKRAKFAFVAWIGSSVSALKRAKCSIDKSLVKEIVSVGYYFFFHFDAIAFAKYPVYIVFFV